jgi:hypothetical protein
MSFELDPLFHTETMVKILQNQGYLQHAAKICEKILAREPDHRNVRDLLDQMRGSSTRNSIVSAIPVTIEDLEDEVTEPGIAFEALMASESESSEMKVEEMRRQKLEKLQFLLKKIQERS